MQNRAFRLLPLASLLACLLSCGESAQIDSPPLPLELDLYWPSTLYGPRYAVAEVWAGNTPLESDQMMQSFLQDYFWTVENSTKTDMMHQSYLPIPDGSDGRSEILARFTVVDLWGDTLSDTLRVELPLWVKLVSPVAGYVAGVGEQVRFIYQSNKPVQLELWQCKSEEKTCAPLIPDLGAQAKLDSGVYYWGVQGTQNFRYLEVRPQEQP
jgi:hypothetical protein